MATKLQRTEADNGWIDPETQEVYFDNGATGCHKTFEMPERTEADEKLRRDIDLLAKHGTEPTMISGVPVANGSPCGEVALRYNSGKPSFHYILFFPRVIELLAKIFEGGEHKYDYCNWRKGGNPDKSYLDAAMRHLAKWQGKGEIFDEDYKTHHIGHAIWNLMVLFELNGHEIIESKHAFMKAMENMDEIKRLREEQDARDKSSSTTGS